MAVFGISMVRDEVDVVETVIRNMLEQVDSVIVLDNGSVDGTREVLESLPVEVIDDPDQRYYQSEKMSRLAARAAAAGATWVVPFDADEMWHSSRGRIAERLAELEPGVRVAKAAILDYRPTKLDSADADPIRRLTWRRGEVEPLPKVACRTRSGMVIATGNHSVSYPKPKGRLRRRLERPPLDPSEGLLFVRHFPYRSLAQFISKVRNGAAALAATDSAVSVGSHWRMWGDMYREGGAEALERYYYEHHCSSDPEADGFVREPAQEMIRASLAG